MTVIGIDSHKDTLAGCLIDTTGTAVDHREIPNTVAGHGELVAWAAAVKAHRVAIEGSGHYGRPAAEALIQAGVTVVEVPAQMTAAALRSRRTGAKTDRIDALEIARVAARDDDLPTPRCADDTADIACLVDYRSELVKQRTATMNRLHSDLSKIQCGYHKNTAAFTTAKGLDKAYRILRGDKTAAARVARGRITQIRVLNRQIKALTGEITQTVNASGTTLTSILGVGALGAAEIITQTGDPERYATKARYAMANGTAPIAASSGRVTRHRLNRGGNRRLNRTIHTAALTQIARPDTEGRAYYERCRQRGKSKREAIRSLKRRISDRIWVHLQQDQKQEKLTLRLT